MPRFDTDAVAPLNCHPPMLKLPEPLSRKPVWPSTQPARRAFKETRAEWSLEDAGERDVAVGVVVEPPLERLERQGTPLEEG